MTTIAWDGKVVAADTQLVMDTSERAQFPVHKLFDYTDGDVFRVFAAAGQRGPAMRAIAWCLEPELHSFPDGDWAILLFTKSNAVLFTNHNSVGTIVKPPFALGSGQHFALGALMAGATAREAVEIGIKCDVMSGGAVEEMVTSPLEIREAAE